jgi:hypothetical protein
MMKNFNEDNKKLTYEDRIVAFIDILGFRQMINETIKDDIVNQDKIDILAAVLTMIKVEFEKVAEDSELPYSFMITYFSDSIVLSVRRDYNIGLLTIFEILKRIQIRLIDRKILLRGGVVIGKIVHQENMIFGPAMNDAYDLESKSALYPRITIDPDVMEMSASENELADGLFSVKDFDHQKTFEMDFDNTYYIDYFTDILAYLEDGNEAKYYKNLRALIRAGVNRINRLDLLYNFHLHPFEIFAALQQARMHKRLRR